jgi:WD40 repeat protein
MPIAGDARDEHPCQLRADLYGRSSICAGQMPFSAFLVALSPSEPILAIGNFDGSVLLWDTDTRDTVHTFLGHTDTVNAMAFCPASRLLATATTGGTVRLWNTETSS